MASDLLKKSVDDQPTDGHLLLLVSGAEEEGKTLKVLAVDVLVAENGKSHWTYDYELMERSDPNLVIRRGQVFHVLLSLNRNYQPATDAISLVFTVTGCTNCCHWPLVNSLTHLLFQMPNSPAPATARSWWSRCCPPAKHVPPDGRPRSSKPSTPISKCR